MPELPEVEVVRRGLEPAMLSKKITSLHVRRRDLRVPVPDRFEAMLEGSMVQALERRGKYIIGHMAAPSSESFVLHLGMSGRIRIYTPDQTVETLKHDHVVFMMDDGTHIVFHDPRRFGMLYPVPTISWQSQPPFSLMGPEPLGNGFSGEVLHGALAGRRISIKAALLDQRVVSGVGNIYACEALYMAGISPERSACDVRLEEADRLAHAIRSVLTDAIEAGGSTLKDYAQTDGKLGYFQHRFSVYDREGRACPEASCVCGESGGVRRIVQSGRSTFYCPVRQV